MKINITEQQVFELQANVNFKPLVDQLLTIQTLEVAKGNIPRSDGVIRVDDSRLDFATIQAVNGFNGVEFSDIPIYIEFPSSIYSTDVPAWFPSLTKDDGSGNQIPNTYGDIKTRDRLDKTFGLTGLGLVDVASLSQIMVLVGVTALSLKEAQVLTSGVLYVVPEV